MEAAGEDLTLPDCAAEFLIGHLNEIGPVVPGGMGLAPIGWRDLEAWQACTGIRLPPWQARLLIELSRAYFAFTAKAEKPDCPPPWGDEQRDEDRREKLAQRLKSALRGLMIKPKR